MSQVVSAIADLGRQLLSRGYIVLTNHNLIEIRVSYQVVGGVPANSPGAAQR